MTRKNEGISVIVPWILSPQTAGGCVNALLEQECGPQEIIVISEKGSKSPLPDDPRIKSAHISSDTAPGRLELLKKGVGIAKTQITVWIDPRYLPGHNDWLTRLTAPLNDETTGAISGPERQTGVEGLAGHFARIVSRLTKQEKKRLKQVDIVSLKCCALRTCMLEEIMSDGESGLPAQAEPVELSMRIRQAGFKVMFNPEARAAAAAGETARAPRIMDTLLGGLRYGEADAFLGERWGIDWLHGRIFMAALVSILVPLPALYQLPYAVIAAAVLFGWGWFAGFRIPRVPWEWPVAVVNLLVFICIILLVRGDWAPAIFPPRRWHPAIIRQWLFVLSMPVSYLVIVLTAGSLTALRGLTGFKSLSYLPALIPLSALWHLLSGIGYARKHFFKRR